MASGAAPGKRPVTRVAEGLVSVVMPFFEPPAAFMREAIESVLAQSYPDWELLLVNDGSRGESVALARDYAQRHPQRIRYLEHEGALNRGHSASRNLALRQARGEYLAFLDADDVWLPGKLEEQLAILRSFPQIGSVYGNTLYWFSWTGRPEDAALDFVPPLGVPTDWVTPPPGVLARMLSGAATVPCTCSLLVRRSLLNRSGGFEEAFTGLFEDQVFYAKVFLGAPVYVASQCWDRYRRHSASMCARASRDDAAAGRRKFLQWVREYVLQTGIDNGSVQQAVTRGLWELDHPWGARILRSGRRARRLGGQLTTWLGDPAD
jgi:glycosyltransferase involved in cell wall biosynthesis